MSSFFAVLFFSMQPATTDVYTLSLHDALPISFATHKWFPKDRLVECANAPEFQAAWRAEAKRARRPGTRSEEHTSELQSLTNLVCRLLLEKKNKNQYDGPRPPNLLPTRSRPSH